MTSFLLKSLDISYHGDLLRIASQSCRLLEHFLLSCQSRSSKILISLFFLNIPRYIYIWGFGHFNSLKSPLEVGFKHNRTESEKVVG